MTETGRRTAALAADGPTTTSAWTGWVVFGGVMMMMLGGFGAIQGIVAIFDPGYYLVGPDGFVVGVDYTIWGWTHLVLGLLIVGTGIGVMAGNTAARIAGIVLAVLNALLNITFLPAYPIWSTTVIALDVVVIYALAVHGRELRTDS